MTAFILGNGLSRKHIDLNQLKLHGSIYGCNALYREFTPDVLVATDRPIATQIQESGYSSKHRFHTRKPIANLGAKPVPTEYYGNSSGPIACSLAALDGHKQIYLLGFDLGADQNNSFNNIYAGTEFYKAQGSNPTFTGNWIQQLIKITKDFPSITFHRVHGDTTAVVDEFQRISNLKVVTIENFSNQFNI